MTLSSLSCKCLIYALSVTGSHSNDPPSPAAAPVTVCFSHCLALHQLPQREPPWPPRPQTLVQKCRPLEHEAERQQAVEWDLRRVRQSDAHVQGNQTSGGRLGPLELPVCLEQGTLKARAKLGSTPWSPSQFFTALIEGWQMGMSDLVRSWETSIQLDGCGPDF